LNQNELRRSGILRQRRPKPSPGITSVNLATVPGFRQTPNHKAALDRFIIPGSNPNDRQPLPRLRSLQAGDLGHRFQILALQTVAHGPPVSEVSQAARCPLPKICQNRL
jgi:hypothetical protein